MGAGTAEPGKGHSLESPCVAGSCCLWLLRDHLDYEGWMARPERVLQTQGGPSCRQQLSPLLERRWDSIWTELLGVGMLWGGEWWLADGLTGLDPCLASPHLRGDILLASAHQAPCWLWFTCHLLGLFPGEGDEMCSLWQPRLKLCSCRRGVFPQFASRLLPQAGIGGAVARFEGLLAAVLCLSWGTNQKAFPAS